MNEALNTVLKHWIKQPRPVALVRHHLGSYGMPSDHAQFMLFAATYVMMFAALRWGQPGWARAGWALGCIFLATVVCLSRVYLMYHTPAQVIVGAAVGMVTGIVWFGFTELFLVPLFPMIENLPVSRFLLIRDCSASQDVLAAEYKATSGVFVRQKAAAAVGRPVHDSEDDMEADAHWRTNSDAGQSTRRRVV
jgi:dolichyldiphosphatase